MARYCMESPSCWAVAATIWHIASPVGRASLAMATVLQPLERAHFENMYPIPAAITLSASESSLFMLFSSPSAANTLRHPEAEIIIFLNEL